MMQTPVEGELFVTVVEGTLSLPPVSRRVEGSSRSYLVYLRVLTRPVSYVAERIPLFNLTEPLFVTSLLH